MCVGSCGDVVCNSTHCLFRIQDLGTEGGFPTEQFVELWDIGGNPRYKDVRKMFYDAVDGESAVHCAADDSSLAIFRADVAYFLLCCRRDVCVGFECEGLIAAYRRMARGAYNHGNT